MVRGQPPSDSKLGQWFRCNLFLFCNLSQLEIGHGGSHVATILTKRLVLRGVLRFGEFGSYFAANFPRWLS